MRGSTFSASWYRVASLTPRLRSHARLHRHTYRGETWWVMRDLSSDQVHRFSPAGYLMIGLMDGRRTVQDVWDVAMARLGDDAPTQDETIDLLARLHAADVLQCDVSPDTAELLERHERIERKTRASQWLSPLSWKLPLVDPERWLHATRALARPVFGPLGALVWVAVVGLAVVLGAAHWRDLGSNVLDHLLVPQNAFVIWLVFPVVKILHELGHAYAVKAWGGEVHDMGVMFLVFTPVPYVDASSASAFPSKWQRMVVGLAGMLVELFLAALALFVWLAAEPGLVRTLAYDVIVVAGVSTVLFNANPLIRYDGYYVLADLLEIPNLAARSRRYLGYLAERYLLGRRESERPDATPSERAWFVTYGITSAVYRVLVMVGIVLFVMTASFYGGLALALLMGVQWAILPAARAVRSLVSGPRLRGVRGRAIGLVTVAAAAVIALLGFVPVPLRSVAEGVVWIPDEAFVRAETEGFVTTVVAPPGGRVQRGDVLVVCRDPALDARVAVLEGRRDELEARFREKRVGDPVKAEIVREELSYVQAELARARERRAALEVRSAVGGTFVVTDPESLPGRFVKKGELLAYVVDLETLTVRTVVPQTAIDLVRGHTEGVEVRLAERPADARPAVLRREVPGATERLPSPALGNQGGGAVGTDPRDPEGRTAVRKVFQVDLELPLPDGLVNLGGRVYVRFDHGREPLATQWYRQLRQLFLARFDV